MSESKSQALLAIDKECYRKQFLNLEFGADLASEIAVTHGFRDALVRIPQGSSLVFKVGTDHFLKLTPPFFEDSMEAEVLAAKIIANQLPFPTPSVIAEGNIGTWKYVICTAVPGEQAKDVTATMDPANRLIFAQDIGTAIRSIHNIHCAGFERKFGPWEKYLADCLQNQRSIHLARGNSEEWADKIDCFMRKNSAVLKKLGPAKMIHADLNHEHLLLSKQNNIWRLSGIIDFADAMNAPIEMELVLPILCFFRGKTEHQSELFKAANITPEFRDARHSCLMMAMTLLNRFVAFHDWFSGEIKRGAKTVEEIAVTVFPPL